MPRKPRNKGPTPESRRENPIASSVHGAGHPGPGLAARAKRFFRRLFLTLILITLVAVPPLLYFTDVAPPIRQEMRKRVAEYSLYRKTERELGEARQTIANLEEELAALKLEREHPDPPPSRAAPSPEIPPAEKPEPDPEPDTAPQQTATITRTRKNETVQTLRNGVTVRQYVDIRHGEIASRVRGRKEAYELETRLKINQPKANRTIAELASLNAELPAILPGLKELLENGRVSPLFEKIYELKIEQVVKEMSSPGEMETRHNFYDCETILSLTHPRTREKVLLMQGEMDVVADGTDGDRWPYLNESIANSRYFQHATSYRWKKKSDTPNPLLPRSQAELKKVLARYAVRGLSQSENARLRSRRDELRRHIREMQSTSFLIAEVDPFIVLPLSFLNQSKLSHPPAIGDFAVVIYRDKLYPAICGDAGPSWKLGEGSLFLARTLNPRATPNYRPVSDLKVTYLVFPGTRPQKSDHPDLIEWRKKCGNLLERIGGLGEGYRLHNWRDLPAERRAIGELEKLSGEFPPLIEKRDQAVTEAKNALADAEKRERQWREELAKLEEPAQEKKASETAAEEAPDADEAREAKKKAEELRKKCRAVEKEKTDLKDQLEEAEKAAREVRVLSDRAKATIEEAKAIAELPESTPRERSTDLVLSALAECEAALEKSR